jgi:hypothetical protein
MIEIPHRRVLHKIQARLKDSGIAWVITGSFGMALQGMDLPVLDIDLQTDEAGAYAIENRFSEYVTTPVRYLASERMRSHLGKLEIDRVTVEIMGALQKRIDDQAWEPPVDVGQYRKWVEIDRMRIPVLALDYEYEAYLKLGRVEKARKIREWLEGQK